MPPCHEAVVASAVGKFVWLSAFDRVGVFLVVMHHMVADFGHVKKLQFAVRTLMDDLGVLHTVLLADRGAPQLGPFGLASRLSTNQGYCPR